MARTVAKGSKGLAVFNLIVAIVAALFWIFWFGILGLEALYVVLIALALINTFALWGTGREVEEDTTRTDQSRRGYGQPYTDDPHTGTHTEQKYDRGGFKDY